jgi:hypothetical protein
MANVKVKEDKTVVQPKFKVCNNIRYGAQEYVAE